MSDRVIIGTSNWGLTPDISSKFNGFFSATVETLTYAAYYPAPFPLAQIDKLFHRVRQYSLSTDISATTPLGTVSFPGGDLTGGPINAAGNPMTTESEHADASIAGPAISMTQSAAGPGILSGNIAISMFFDPAGVGYLPAIYFDGTDYFPAFFLLGIISASDPGSAESAVIQFSSSPDEFSPPDGFIIGTFDGINIPIYYLASATAGASFNITTLDITISTNPDSYWAYAAKDTSAIYDTTDGHQLQDPRN